MGLKKIKQFESFLKENDEISFEINEEGERDSREELKGSLKKFMDAQSSLWKAYEDMRSSYKEIASMHDSMRRSGDHEAATFIDKVFSLTEGSYLYYIKATKKYLIEERDIKPMMDLQKFVQAKPAKIPATLAAAGYNNAEDFNKIVSFLKSTFDSDSTNKYVQYKRYYGIGISKNPDISGWSDDSALRGVQSAMGGFRIVTQNMDEKQLAKLNKELSKLGFSVYKSARNTNQ